MIRVLRDVMSRIRIRIPQKAGPSAKDMMNQCAVSLTTGIYVSTFRRRIVQNYEKTVSFLHYIFTENKRNRRSRLSSQYNYFSSLLNIRSRFRETYCLRLQHTTLKHTRCSVRLRELQPLALNRYFLNPSKAGCDSSNFHYY